MWYFSIINNARSREKNIDGYTERHHIVPRSLGGNNKKENLIILTAREHFICHRLLVKMTSNSDRVKMAYAMRCMMNLENEHQFRYRINSFNYERLKIQTNKILSGRMSGANNPYYGKQHTDEVKTKMSVLRRERIELGLLEGMSGKHHSSATKEKLRESNKKQFEDSSQLEIRRLKTKQQMENPERRYASGNGKRGKHWYYNTNSNKSIFCFEKDVPAGYIKGRKMNSIKKKGGVI